MYLLFIILLVVLYIPLSVVVGLTKPYSGGTPRKSRSRRRRRR